VTSQKTEHTRPEGVRDAETVYRRLSEALTALRAEHRASIRTIRENIEKRRLRDVKKRLGRL